MDLVVAMTTTVENSLLSSHYCEATTCCRFVAKQLGKFALIAAATKANLIGICGATAFAASKWAWLEFTVVVDFLI